MCPWMWFRSDPNYYGHLKFKIRNIHVSASATLDTDKQMITELKSLDINERELIIDMSSDSFKVKIHGDVLGIMGKITKAVAWVVKKVAKNAIVN